MYWVAMSDFAGETVVGSVGAVLGVAFDAVDVVEDTDAVRCIDASARSLASRMPSRTTRCRRC